MQIHTLIIRHITSLGGGKDSLKRNNTIQRTQNYGTDRTHLFR